MKKLLLITISILILLSGCSKKLAWDDVESIYKDAEQEVNNILGTIETVSKDDYKGLLTELKDYIDEVKFSQDQDNQDLLKRTYKVAEYIETFASLFEGSSSQQLLALAQDAKNLIKSVYGGNKDDFNKLKEEIQTNIEDISSWADEEWSSVEKKAKLFWEDVEDQLNKIEEDAKESIIAFDRINEYNLEELKHTIIDNYQLIKDGVTEDTNEIAKQMYAAAIQLKEYTRKIYNDDADKVYEFAKHAISYIQEAYGKVLEDEDKLVESFDADIANATKWTQSTWNEITKQLKLYAMQ